MREIRGISCCYEMWDTSNLNVPSKPRTNPRSKQDRCPTFAPPIPACRGAYVGGKRWGEALQPLCTLTGRHSVSPARRAREPVGIRSPASSLKSITRGSTPASTADGLIGALRDQDQATDRRLLVLSEELASVLNRGDATWQFRQASVWPGAAT